MKKEVQVRNNFELLNIFMQYACDHPKILDKIPAGAELVILPENDPDMLKENMKIVEKMKKKGTRFVVVKMRIPEAMPEPQIEVLAG